MELSKILGHPPNVYVTKKCGPDINGSIMFQSAIPINVPSMRVDCPYCESGYVKLPIERVGDQVKLIGIKDPHKCVNCNQWFRISVELKLTGKKLDTSL